MVQFLVSALVLYLHVLKYALIDVLQYHLLVLLILALIKIQQLSTLICL